MDVGTLNATLRTGTGKSITRKLRQQGKIPAVCYGKGAEPVLLTIDPLELLKSLDPIKRANTLLTLKVGDGSAKAKSQDLTVMVRDWQKNALRGDVTHADFILVHLDQDVHAVVPLEIVGKADGVKLGGTLHQVFRTLEIACRPDKIPTKIEVNVDKLGLGDALHVRDLVLGDGIKPLIDGGQTICTVTVPRAEKAAAETEVAAAEGAAPAEGAAAKPGAPAAGAKPGAAAPAAGAKPGEKAAAPAKAAGKK